jgi:hypothetical protein
MVKNMQTCHYWIVRTIVPTVNCIEFLVKRSKDWTWSKYHFPASSMSALSPCTLATSSPLAPTKKYSEGQLLRKLKSSCPTVTGRSQVPSYGDLTKVWLAGSFLGRVGTYMSKPAPKNCFFFCHRSLHYIAPYVRVHIYGRNGSSHIGAMPAATLLASNDIGLVSSCSGRPNINCHALTSALLQYTRHAKKLQWGPIGLYKSLVSS